MSFDSRYHFQYCPKLVLFNSDISSVFLARRNGEQDYNGVYSFIGGKMEIGDASIVSAIKREKNEEIGPQAKIRLFPLLSHNIVFTKSSGERMILPYYLGIMADGEIQLNLGEYSECSWVPVEQIETFEPKTDAIPEAVRWAKRVMPLLSESDFVVI